MAGLVFAGDAGEILGGEPGVVGELTALGCDQALGGGGAVEGEGGGLLADFVAPLVAELAADVGLGEAVVDGVGVFEVEVGFDVDSVVFEDGRFEAGACAAPLGLADTAEVIVVEVGVVVLQASGEGEVLNKHVAIGFVEHGFAPDFIEDFFVGRFSCQGWQTESRCQGEGGILFLIHVLCSWLG